MNTTTYIVQEDGSVKEIMVRPETTTERIIPGKIYQAICLQRRTKITADTAEIVAMEAKLPEVIAKLPVKVEEV